jgi:hypothetical protein
MKRRKDHPKSLVESIMEAIDEAVPGRGAEIYWLAFHRYEECVAREKLLAAEKQLAGTAPRPEEWTVW